MLDKWAIYHLKVDISYQIESMFVLMLLSFSLQSKNKHYAYLPSIYFLQEANIFSFRVVEMETNSKLGHQVNEYIFFINFLFFYCKAP